MFQDPAIRDSIGTLSGGVRARHWFIYFMQQRIRFNATWSKHNFLWILILLQLLQLVTIRVVILWHSSKTLRGISSLLIFNFTFLFHLMLPVFFYFLWCAILLVTRIWGASFILMSPALFTVPLREFNEIDVDCFSDNGSLRGPSTTISAACTNDKKNQPCFDTSVNECIWDLKGSPTEHWERLTFTPGTPSVRNDSSSAAPKPPIRCNVTSQWKWIFTDFSQK